MNTDVTMEDIRAARERIAGGIEETPCTASSALSALYGAQIFLKQEYLQRTGSFKERGARNALMQLPAWQKDRGAIAASAGNHALGMAHHGRLLGIPITVVMPRFAPLIKVEWLFDLQINVIAFAISAVIGVVFGYFPARRAASLNPIDALRHE